MTVGAGISRPSGVEVGASGPKIVKPLTTALRARLTKVTPEIHEEMIAALDKTRGY